MNRSTHLRQIRTAMDSWSAASTERAPWLITLTGGVQITILAPLGCAVELEEQGHAIIAAPAQEITAAELHEHSIHYAGRAICHGGGTWTRIEAVRLSAHQGVEIALADGSALQACFPEEATYWVTVERV